MCEKLLRLVPPVAQYRRTALDDDLNALVPWSEANESFDESTDVDWRDWLVYPSDDDTPFDPLSPFPADQIEQIHAFLDGRQRALELLREGARRRRVRFPDPIDIHATVKRVGREVADRVADVRPLRWFHVMGRLGRFTRSSRRSRFESLMNLWPAQLQAGFPFDLLEEGERTKAILAEHQELLGPEIVEAWQPLTDARLEAARKKLHDCPNPLGNLLANALLCLDLSLTENPHRSILAQTQALLGGALKT